MTTTTISTVEMAPALHPLPLATALSTLSPTLAGIVQTSQTLSPADRLWLAKLLLNSLVIEEEESVVAKTNGHSENGHTESGPIADDAWPSSEELVRQIQALPAEPDAFHPATKSIEVWFSEQAINPSPLSSISSRQWEQLWGKFERDLKAFEQSHAIAEGWDADHG